MPRISLVRTESLTSTDYDEMWELYRLSHDVSRQTFEAKTVEKFSHICLMRHRGRVIGFFGADGEVVETPSGKRFYAQYQGQAMLDRRWRKTGWSVMGPVVLGLHGVWRARRLPYVLWQDAVTVRTFMLIAKHAVVLPAPHAAHARRSAGAPRRAGSPSLWEPILLGQWGRA